MLLNPQKANRLSTYVLSSSAKIYSMKSIFSALAILFLSFSAFAQKQNEALGCIDKVMVVQSEELKSTFKKQGLTVYRDAMITMESNMPLPIAIQMVKGRIYQLIFIGNKKSSKVSMEILNGDDKRVALKETSKGGNNYIVYSFIPDKTDVYLVMLSQKFKGKTICGSFTLLHDAPAAPATENKTATPAKK